MKLSERLYADAKEEEERYEDYWTETLREYAREAAKLEEEVERWKPSGWPK